MKKKIILVIVCLLLCGCDATVKINIDDGIKENITLTETDSAKFDTVGATGWSLRELMRIKTQKDEFDTNSYSVKFKEKDNLLQLKMSDEISLDNVKGLTLLNQCYLNPTVKMSKENILIDTGTNFKCYEYYEHLDKVTIELVSNHKINEHNATRVEKNKYIWSFDKDSDKRIMINFKKEKSVNKIPYIISGIVVIVLIVGISVFVKNKHKDSNSI